MYVNGIQCLLARRFIEAGVRFVEVNDQWWDSHSQQGGFSYGASDDRGQKAIEGRMHIHDLHATILHLLGLDHEKLTYRYAGRDFRLTDVHGKVPNEILA